MCYCERDAIRVLIHVKAKAFFPGIKYHEEALDNIAEAFQLRSTLQIHTLPNERLAELAAALVRALPASACPPEHKTAV